MKKTLLVIILMLVTAMGGCLSNDDEPKDEIPLLSVNNSYMDSYQYNNVAPMGMGNQTDAPINASNVTLIINITMESLFHEPVGWEQGYVNVSIVNENGTTLWESEQTNQRTNHTFILENHSGNLSLRVTSSGSDDTQDSLPGDWYVISFDVTYRWREY